MQAGRSGRPDWVTRMDGLRAETLNRDASWDKLQQRLAGKKKHKKYYAWLAIPAAAALLLIWKLNTGQNSYEGQTKEIEGLSNLSFSFNEKVNDSPTNTEIISNLNSKKRISITSIIHPLENPLPKVDTITKDITLAIPFPLDSAKKPAPTEVMVKIIAKKKPAMVHLNELNQNTVYPLAPREVAKTEVPLLKNIFNPAYRAEEINPENELQNINRKKLALPFRGQSQKD